MSHDGMQSALWPEGRALNGQWAVIWRTLDTACVVSHLRPVAHLPPTQTDSTVEPETRGWCAALGPGHGNVGLHSLAPLHSDHPGPGPEMPQCTAAAGRQAGQRQAGAAA